MFELFWNRLLFCGSRPVKIIRLISKGTIEEGMLQIAQDKLQLEREVTGIEGKELFNIT